MSGQVALVTGGGRGIGANVARELADAGMRVAVAARTSEQVERVAQEIGGLSLEVDVSDEPSVGRMVEETRCELGPIDLLVNNAGVTNPSDAPPIWEERPRDWWRVFEINVLGAYLCCRAVLVASAYPVDSKCRSGGPPHDLVVGRGLVLGAEPEQGLEGRHRRAAAVVAKDVLVEVDLQVGIANAPVGAVHPGLQVRDRAVGAGQVGLRARRRLPLAAGAMVVAGLGEAGIALPAVGADDRARARSSP